MILPEVVTARLKVPVPTELAADMLYPAVEVTYALLLLWVFTVRLVTATSIALAPLAPIAPVLASSARVPAVMA